MHQCNQPSSQKHINANFPLWGLEHCPNQGKNCRHFHTFADEDAMRWAKSYLPFKGYIPQSIYVTYIQHTDHISLEVQSLVDVIQIYYISLEVQSLVAV